MQYRSRRIWNKIKGLQKVEILICRLCCFLGWWSIYLSFLQPEKTAKKENVKKPFFIVFARVKKLFTHYEPFAETILRT